MRSLLVGLLDEFVEDKTIVVQRRARADVSVFGVRLVRPHAEGDDPPVGGRRLRGAAGGDETGRVLDHVVGREHQEHRVLVAPLRERRSRGDGRAGIAPHRLEQDVGLGVDLGQLLGDQETILAVGDDDRPREQAGLGHAQHGVLKGRAWTEQLQELLRPALARAWPKPRARSAAHDQRDDPVGH